MRGSCLNFKAIKKKGRKKVRKVLSVVLSVALAVTSMTFIPTMDTRAAVNSSSGSGSWNLVWSDEFNQTPGTAPNSNYWQYDIGNGDSGWGNNEIQYYTNSTSNVYIAETSGTTDGRALALKAKRESNGQLTSGRIKTLDKQTIKYGRIEAKLRVENGQQNGVWPAFWMMGNDITSQGWPNCGEIDIMEHRNMESEIIGTLHWNPVANNASYGHTYAGSETNGQFAYIDTIASWHTYAVEWYEDCMKWYVDGVCYETIYLTSEMQEEFHKEHFILLNLALGGPSTPFTKNITIDSSFTEATMYVDYVRVYQGTDSNFYIRQKSDTSQVVTEPNPYDGMTECAKDTWQSLGVWDYQLGSWAGASGYYSGGNQSGNFSLILSSTNKNNWGAMTRVANIPVTPGHTYNYTVNLSSTKAGSVLVKEDVSAVSEFTHNVAVGDNTLTGSFTAGADQTTATILVDLRGIDAGTQLDFKGYSITDTSSGPVVTPTEKPTESPTQSGGTTVKDWSSIDYAGDGAGGGAYTNKYKFYCENTEVKLVNIQNPDFSTAAGLYVTFPAGISSCSLGAGNYDIQGAGIVLHLSAFSAKETQFTVTDAMGTYTCYVYYEDGTGSFVETPTEEPTEAPTEEPTTISTEEFTAASTVIDGVTYDNVVVKSQVNATSSTNESDELTADKAVDKDVSTRWASAQSDNQYLIVDLGKEYNIKAFSIFWEAASAASYAIQVSNDGQNFTNAATYTSTAGERKDEIVLDEEISARYIKIDCYTRTTPYGFSIYEMAVWGKEADSLVITEDMEINGYQISATAGGMRTVYSVDSTVEGQKVTEVGLIYGIDKEGFNRNDMVAGSANSTVFMAAGTAENGKFSAAVSKSESYAMTMKFAAGTAEEFNTVYYVRAYAKLADGTYAYTNIEQYTIYELADYLYQNQLMTNYYSHNYLFENILTVVKSDYAVKEYDWNKIIVLT